MKPTLSSGSLRWGAGPPLSGVIAMGRLLGRIFLAGVASVASTALAGCDYPDLTVVAFYKGYECHDHHLLLNFSPNIYNEGTGDAVLSNKPWFSVYPAVKLPGFVPWIQTCWSGLPCPLTLKPGEVVSIGPVQVYLPPEPSGKAYKLIVEVDPTYAYKESNDSNNTGYVDIPADVCGH